MNTMKILDSYWFTPMGGDIVGIVQVETKFDGIKYYIGTIKKWPGESLDKENDERIISETGAKFPKEVGDFLFLV